jgi:hypothetical protein
MNDKAASTRSVAESLTVTERVARPVIKGNEERSKQIVRGSIEFMRTHLGLA